MSARFPDEGTIQTALSLAVRAPSMQNSQPWRWQVAPLSLDLYADGSRGRPNTACGSRAQLLSCGAALNHCVIGFAALGWQAKVHRFPDKDDPEHLAAIELHRFPAVELDVTLAAAIPRRRSDRRRYSAWPVPRGDLALMGARAARGGVTIRRVEASSELANFATRVVGQQAAECVGLAGRVPQLATCSGRYGSDVGATHPGSGPVESGSPLRDSGFAATELGPVTENSGAGDNGIVVVLGTGNDDGMAHLRAGEATSVVLLTATALGLASCPVTEPLDTVEARESAQKSIFPSGGFPQILVRIGWAPVNADPLPAGPRRNLSTVVVWSDGIGGMS